MKTKHLIIAFITLFSAAAVAENVSYGNMKQWRSHLSYANVSELADTGNDIYAIASGSLLSIDKKSEEITYYSKLTGLNGSNISNIGYDAKTRTLLVAYANGLMDCIVNGSIYVLPDLANQQISSSKKSNSIFIRDGKAYLGMPFGVLVVNLQRREIADTYHPGSNGEEVGILQVAILQDSIYAISADSLYIANLNDNLSDYNNWHTEKTLPSADKNVEIVVCDNTIYLHSGTNIWSRTQTKSWTPFHAGYAWQHIKSSNGKILLSLVGETYLVEGNELKNLQFYCVSAASCRAMTDMIYNSNRDIWLAAGTRGVVKIPRFGTSEQDMTQFFKPTGPYENFSFKAAVSNDKLVMVPGYFESLTQYFRPGGVMIFDEKNDSYTWTNYTIDNFHEWCDDVHTTDFVDVEIDPNDDSHFFISSYGHGMIEFRNNTFYKRHTPYNSIIDSIADVKTREPIKERPYIWVLTTKFDPMGNLWLANCNDYGYLFKMVDKNGQWYRFNYNTPIGRTHNILISNDDKNLKIYTMIKSPAGIGLFNDNGTYRNMSDDKSVFVSAFVDQDNKSITPDYIYTICQMKDGSLWAGTNNGLFIIDNPTTLYKSNKCRRIKIPRNDGTNLADYLLDSEEISIIVEDGAGRKWIGTKASGLFLVSQDGLETIEHFTVDNSPLPSNQINDIDIRPKTGEVFICTGGGLVSYQSDANAPKENFDKAYAYPNPVRPNYQGTIAITGLMDNTTVYIMDSGGNLVCKTRSNGGLAVWDGCLANGKRATAGVYTAMCNTESEHTVVKILVIR